MHLNPGARTLVADYGRARRPLRAGLGRLPHLHRCVSPRRRLRCRAANERSTTATALTGDVASRSWAARPSSSAARLAAALGLAPADALAVGDGANDLGMIEAAGLGVAYRAKPIIAEKADARVDHADLTALLYFQGYRAEEFVS